MYIKRSCNSQLLSQYPGNFSTGVVQLHFQHHSSASAKPEKSPTTNKKNTPNKAVVVHRACTNKQKKNNTSAFPKRFTREEETAHNSQTGCYAQGPALGPKGSSQISYWDCNTWQNFGDGILSSLVNRWKNGQCHSHEVGCSHRSARLHFLSGSVPFPHQAALPAQPSQYPRCTPSGRSRNSSCAPHGHMDF